MEDVWTCWKYWEIRCMHLVAVQYLIYSIISKFGRELLFCSGNKNTTQCWGQQQPQRMAGHYFSVRCCEMREILFRQASKIGLQIFETDRFIQHIQPIVVAARPTDAVHCVALEHDACIETHLCTTNHPKCGHLRTTNQRSQHFLKHQTRSVQNMWEHELGCTFERRRSEINVNNKNLRYPRKTLRTTPKNSVGNIFWFKRMSISMDHGKIQIGRDTPCDCKAAGHLVNTSVTLEYTKL